MRAIGRSLNEIVRDIVEALGNPEIEPTVRQRIGELRGLTKYAPLSGNRKQNEIQARRLRRWIDDGSKLFAAMPPQLRALLYVEQTGPFNSEERIRADFLRAKGKVDALDRLLGFLRDRCDWILHDEKIGKHGNVDEDQRRAAVAARELCEQVGKPLAWSSPTSTYRNATSLLFEAATGQYGLDTERACESVADVQVIQTQTEKR